MAYSVELTSEFDRELDKLDAVGHDVSGRP